MHITPGAPIPGARTPPRTFAVPPGTLQGHRTRAIAQTETPTRGVAVSGAGGTGHTQGWAQRGMHQRVHSGGRGSPNSMSPWAWGPQNPGRPGNVLPGKGPVLTAWDQRAVRADLRPRAAHLPGATEGLD